MLAAIVPCMFFCGQKRIRSGARIQQGNGTQDSCAILGPAFVLFSERPVHSRNRLLQNWRHHRRCLGLLEEEDLRPAYIVVLFCFGHVGEACLLRDLGPLGFLHVLPWTTRVCCENLGT